MTNQNKKTNLKLYDNSWYQPGSNAIIRMLWYIVNILFFINPLNPFSFIKVFLLRLFGAKIGKGVNIKPAVNIKYPWKLDIGNYVWIGERVWIDNLAKVTLSDNVCLSQGAMLLTGNHDYTKGTFDLMIGEITLEEGVWIGAKATVCPNIICKSHSILTVSSIASNNLDAYGIYQGNPAVKVKERAIQ